MKQKLLLFAAVFFGVIAFLLNYSQIQSERRKIQGDTESVDLIKTTREMASGEVIREQDVAPDRVRRLKSSGSGFSNEITWTQVSRIIGRKLALSKEKNERLHWADIQQAYSRASGLAGVIRKNYRAISIPVDSVSAVTNLIKPGDNVDIIGTFRFPEMRGDNNLDTLTLTILQNVKILATGSNWNVNNSPDGRSGYSTITIELTPKEVEMIIFASQKGKLSLSLRNFEESGFTKDLQSVNFKYLEQNIPGYNQERESLQRVR